MSPTLSFKSLHQGQEHSSCLEQLLYGEQLVALPAASWGGQDGALPAKALKTATHPALHTPEYVQATVPVSIHPGQSGVPPHSGRQGEAGPVLLEKQGCTRAHGTPNLTLSLTVCPTEQNLCLLEQEEVAVHPGPGCLWGCIGGSCSRPRVWEHMGLGLGTFFPGKTPPSGPGHAER